MRAPWSWALTAMSVFGVALLLSPVFGVVISALSGGVEPLGERLGVLLLSTLRLAAGVLTVAGVLGVSLAWLNLNYDYPGRRWLDWAVVLPMAMPAYILAFILLGIFGIGGPVQTALGEWVGAGYTHRDIRSGVTLALVLGFAFYPYVYVLMRAAFQMQGVELMEAARSLGRSPTAAWWRATLPAARPALAMGLALTLMETLSDFGAVSVFGYETFTTAIYREWTGNYRPHIAAQLASILLLLTLSALWLERAARRRASYEQKLQRRVMRRPLSATKGALALAGVLLTLGIGFFLPLAQLAVWTVASLSELDGRYWGWIVNTVSLSCMITAGCLGFGLLVVCLSRWRRGVNRLCLRLAGIGYALPGTMLAAGMALVAGAASRYLPESGALGLLRDILMPGSLLILVLACCCRLMAVSLNPLDSGMLRLRTSLGEVAHSLGAGRARTLMQVYLPLLRPAIAGAALLVFIEAMREMPITLLMRPFGWDTLAVRVYEMSSDGLWESAAAPALALVLVGLIPVRLIVQNFARQ